MKKLHCICKRVAKNKYIEIQVERYKLEDTRRYFDFHIEWTMKVDHAGLRIVIEILGCYFGLTVYDNRHWNEIRKTKENK